jgi:hypothetical protein
MDESMESGEKRGGSATTRKTKTLIGAAVGAVMGMVYCIAFDDQFLYSLGAGRSRSWFLLRQKAASAGNI